MVDGGKQPSVLPPENHFLSARECDIEQWKWMVGEHFHALKMRDAISPKLRVPTQAYAFDGFSETSRITGKEFVAVGSLATGGLSNAWGCGVARYSASEMADFPFPASDMDSSYATVSKRMGISGREIDDMSDYFGLDDYSQPPIEMDALHSSLAREYANQRQRLRGLGFRLGRSRVAALSEDLSGRLACDLSGNCLWGCRRRALYSAADELPALRERENFSVGQGFVVDSLVRSGDSWTVVGNINDTKERQSVAARSIVLAAGTLASTRLVLQTLKSSISVQMLSCPTAAFLIWLPRLLGAKRTPGFGLGQLSYSLDLQDGIGAFGSTFSTMGIPIAEFARHVPFKRRFGIDLLRGLLSSCVVGNIFLPGILTAAKASLIKDGSLIVSGAYSDDVASLMTEANRKLRRSYAILGAVLLPGSFSVGTPGGDIHYAGTLPMRKEPKMGETNSLGEARGLEGIYVVDGACLPSLPAKSHTLTIMANADRIGYLLAERMQREHY
jgi:hypothetical protein